MSEPDELPELEGIDASDEFRRYVFELRQTWKPRSDYGDSRPENEESEEPTMSTNSTSDSTDSETTMMTRRAAMKTGATAVATAATIGVGAGTVGASSALDVDGEYVQAPFLRGSVTVATHEPEFNPLQFVNDSGEPSSLADYGAEIAPREDDETPHNPVTLTAAHFDAADYYAFPREEQYDESGDGDAETDVTALDPTHWTVDESGSAGTMTVAETTSPADGPGLQVSTSSQTSGDVAIASFDSSYLEITSGEDRKLLQLVLDANTVEAGVTVAFRVTDEDGDTREAVIDPAGDDTNADVIATATASGLVYQVPMGELPITANGDGTFNNLQELEIEIADANADVSIYGLNLERESEWVYGVEEYTNSDDELDTQEITEPSGSFSITGLDTIASPLDAAKIADVEYDVELVASKLPEDMLEYEWKEAERYDHPYRFQAVYNFEAITAYDLSWTLAGLYDEVLFPSTRFVEAGIVTGQSEAVALADVQDDEVTLTSRTDTYANAAIDEEVELATAIQAGDFDSVFVDILYTEDEQSAAESTAAAAGPIGGSSGGWTDYLFSLPGMAISAVVGYLGLVKAGVIGATR
ncbi:hypothetical protein HSRCO_0743 [Halanaeroarchaeum sp. HSR-CO]|uniref:hypothetical protein n=1 Tax=Halanaeroarchaeum sp. HSR-CO TaxID=2866382 RepID=UPI00217DC16F|nr:hypothetical protein [Halanaeroarchaeum sp. HSR-CO]UWG47037.1 hypothetical protein HSRCO_0743 [Halanaeroarchaeum sp. HSR-CO]